jgi:hypothetical protein
LPNTSTTITPYFVISSVTAGTGVNKYLISWATTFAGTYSNSYEGTWNETDAYIYHTFTGLSPNTSYYFKLRMFNDYGFIEANPNQVLTTAV